MIFHIRVKVEHAEKQKKKKKLFVLGFVPVVHAGGLEDHNILKSLFMGNEKKKKKSVPFASPGALPPGPPERVYSGL